MKKRILSTMLTASAYALALALTLAACGSQGGTSSSAPSASSGASSPVSSSGDASFPAPLPSISTAPPSGSSSDRSAAPAPSGSSPSNKNQTSDSSAPSRPADPTPQEQGSAMARAYRKALEGIYDDLVYPNGDPLETFEMENNDFAIFDVDGDGDLELVYQNDNSIMAGMATNIYSFEPDSGRLYLELSGFCGMTFYNNGVITIPASHNHGLSQLEDFWPYALYQYDIGGDGYLMMGSVDAWDKELFPESYEGKPFPDDVDQDGDGVVYLITYGGQEVSSTTLDGPAYGQWRDGYIGGAAELDIPWQSMTKENIQAVSF